MTHRNGNDPTSVTRREGRILASQTRSCTDGGGEEDLQQALEVYLDELEAFGHVDPQAFVARYPHIAHELTAHLEGIELMRAIGPSDQQTIRPLATVGDFRIIREVGRGGMGVVYEAEQLSLGRTVALKVLPFAAVLDDRAIARFKNEAKAAATLDHPNIVPIYAVGSEGGVYYYAMSLIQGPTLACIIAELQRQVATNGERELSIAEIALSSATAHSHSEEVLPTCEISCGNHSAEAARACSNSAATDVDIQARVSTKRSTFSATYFRQLAQLGAQAAEALHHAHEQGIVHRDIKPGNLMLDGRGKLWVTDFGLARVESDAGMTVTGDLVGTVRYMAPERALAQSVVVDHRVDVYSLGVTMYELLTLRPAFDGKDRNAVLKQIAFEEAKRPRLLNHSIPVDLETIVLKAMAKEPGERYASCQDLADDLHRFLAKKPIRAKPVSLPERVAKWSYRHRSLVLTTSAAVIVLFLGVLVTTGLLAGAWQRAATASAEYRAQFLAAKANLYRAHVSIANENWEQGHLDAVNRMLDEFQSAPGQPDLRRWEWYFLKSLCFRELESFPGRIVKSSSSNRLPWQCVREGDVLFLREFGSADVKLRLALPERGESSNALVLSPDGKLLLCVTGSWQSGTSSLQLWNLETRQKLQELPSIPHVSDAAWSPDGRQFVTAYATEKITIWDASTFRQIADLPGLEGYGIVRSIAWSPDGERIAAGGNIAGCVGIWDARDQKLLYRSDAHSSLVGSLAFSPDGKQLASASTDQHVILWDVNSGAKIRKFLAHGGHVNDVGWSPDGTVLATAGSDGLIKIWDPIDEMPVNVLRGHRTAVGQLQWIDNQRLVSSAGDGTKLWNKHQEQRTLSLPATDRHVWSPSGQLLYLIVNESNHQTIQVLSLKTGEVENRILWDRQWDLWAIRAIAIDPAGERLAVGESSGSLSIWNLATGQREVTMDVCPADQEYEMRDVNWSPDGSMLATSCLWAGFKIWDSRTGREIASAHLDSQKYRTGGSVMWSPDGSQFATLDFREDARIWDTVPWREIVRLADRSRGWSPPGSRGLSWSPTGDRLAVCLGAGRIVILDAHHGQRILTIQGHTSHVRAIAWSPDGSRLASGSEDHSVKIWSADTGDEVLTLLDHRGSVFSLSWSPDGRKLAAGGDGRLTIWDASVGYERFR